MFSTLHRYAFLCNDENAGGAWEEDCIKHSFSNSYYTFQSPVRTRTPTMYLDFKLDPGATMTQMVTEGWNGFIYVLKGVGKFGGEDSWTESDAHHTLVLGPGDHVQATNTVRRFCQSSHNSFRSRNCLQP